MTPGPAPARFRVVRSDGAVLHESGSRYEAFARKWIRDALGGQSSPLEVLHLDPSGNWLPVAADTVPTDDSQAAALTWSEKTWLAGGERTVPQEDWKTQIVAALEPLTEEDRSRVVGFAASLHDVATRPARAGRFRRPAVAGA